MRQLAAALIVAATMPATALGAGSDGALVVAQAKTEEAAKPPKRMDVATITARGTVEAIDKEKKTVTVKGPKRTLTLQVRDPAKLDVIKVGDPVVAKYYESLALELKKPGTATPGASVQQSTATSKPGDTPAGMVGEQITVTVTIVGIDKKAQTVTIKGPDGATETVKARDPNNLDKVKVGDLVEITYTRALAISLDKPAAKPAAKQ